jgi:hypothetical protein
MYFPDVPFDDTHYEPTRPARVDSTPHYELIANDLRLCLKCNSADEASQASCEKFARFGSFPKSRVDNGGSATLAATNCKNPSHSKATPMH